MTAIPPSLKIITSFLRRAEELEKDSNRDAQVVSYYCRLYAVSKAAKLGNTSDPEISKFLVSQMDILEQAKGSVGTSLPQGKDICLRYAETLFTKADEVDRLGAADKAIAKLFYSVGTIYDIMDQFGDVEEEVLDRRKYAKWKATEILNAIREGRQPEPGGYGESSIKNDAVMGFEDVSISSPEIQSPPPAQHQPAVHQPSTISNSYSSPSPPPSAPLAPPPAATPAFFYKGPPTNNSDPRVKDTVELCHFAVAALKHNDLQLARNRLQEALRRLE